MDRGCIALHKVARTHVLPAIYGFASRFACGGWESRQEVCVAIHEGRIERSFAFYHCTVHITHLRSRSILCTLHTRYEYTMETLFLKKLLKKASVKKGLKHHNDRSHAKY